MNNLNPETLCQNEDILIIQEALGDGVAECCQFLGGGYFCNVYTLSDGSSRPPFVLKVSKPNIYGGRVSSDLLKREVDLNYEYGVPIPYSYVIPVPSYNTGVVVGAYVNNARELRYYDLLNSERLAASFLSLTEVSRLMTEREGCSLDLCGLEAFKAYLIDNLPLRVYPDELKPDFRVSCNLVIDESDQIVQLDQGLLWLKEVPDYRKYSRHIMEANQNFLRGYMYDELVSSLIRRHYQYF